jgi:hypothetical protein
MDLISTLLTTVITSSLVSGLITTILNWYIKSKELGDQRRWEIKREACLEALEIIDARFGDYPWEVNGKPIKVDEQDYISTAKIRSCFNRLVLACTNSKVPELFEKCLYLQVDNTDPDPITMDTVAGLRNAIRKELGFGNDLSTKISWITYINWNTVGKKKPSIKHRPT